MEKRTSVSAATRYDADALRFARETAIDDGMRVTNPAGAAGGDLRFAGASPTGFTVLTLYDATFEVLKPDYMDALRLEIQEVTAALSLTNLTPTLRVTPQVFLRVD